MVSRTSVLIEPANLHKLVFSSLVGADIHEIANQFHTWNPSPTGTRKQTVRDHFDAHTDHRTFREEKARFSIQHIRRLTCVEIDRRAASTSTSRVAARPSDACKGEEATPIMHRAVEWGL